MITSKEFQARIDSRESQISKQYKELGKTDVRHKCFISYHNADQAEVEKFVTDFEDVFIPRVLGVSDADDFINSTNTDYVMDKIRENYLTDSTVTIVMIGNCTWSRKYIDWEIFSTLRDSKLDKLSGLLAIRLPSVENNAGLRLPARLTDNVFKPDSYATYYSYPLSQFSLRSIIDTAFQARDVTAKRELIRNGRDRKSFNDNCS